MYKRQGLNFAKEVLKDIFNRARTLAYAIIDCSIAGMMIAGYSKICEETEILGQKYYHIKVILYDGVEADVYITSLDDIIFGFIAGLSNILLGRPIYLYYSILRDRVMELIYRRIHTQIDRFIFARTPLLLIQGEISLTKPHLSKRMLIYAEKQMKISHIRYLVRNFVARYGFDSWTINKYVNFAINYLFARKRRHKKLEEWLLYASAEEYDKYMIEKWKRFGLDENILKQIIDYLKIVSV